jgi:hypothetical protein
MFNAHVLAFFHSQWRHHGLLALKARGAERILHSRNSAHWGQIYVDEYPAELEIKPTAIVPLKGGLDEWFDRREA